MQIAVEEEENKLTLVEEDSEINLTVSGDGTRKKCFDVVTLAGKYSKIIDSRVTSTYCQRCVIWRKILKVTKNGSHNIMLVT